MSAVRKGQSTFLLHLAAFAVALVAVVTMPVCLDAANAPILGGDVLTITESRDIVEVMHQPGTYFLHVQDSVVGDHCMTCGPSDQIPHAPLATTVAEQVQRVAALPAAMTVGAPSRGTGPITHQATASSLTTAPLSPPPRTIS